ncbi:MAG TPA: transposase [Burkholderiales bacterium]|nr:transposase [Burkholderiales bacterium]
MGELPIRTDSFGADPPGTTEWASAAAPHYRRRRARVDEAILGIYLSGGNTRRLEGALAPLLRGGPIGKDAVSRLVGRLAADFETWPQRDLAAESTRSLSATTGIRACGSGSGASGCRSW